MSKPLQLTLLLLVAFALRLAAGWAWQSRLDGPFGMGDTDSYWQLGTAIAAGKPYEFGEDRAKAFRTPGYPFLLAPVIRIAGEGRAGVMLARAEAALLGALAVLAVWWLTKLLFDDRAALLAACLAAFYPGAIVLGALILSEAPFCPLMLLQLILWILAWQAPSRSRRTLWSLCAGLAAGAATLMRPSWLLFTPFAAAVAIAVECRDAKRMFRHTWIAAWMLLGLVAAMTPWWIRNARAIGHFVPTTLQVGASLYDGLNPRATGASDLDEFVPRFTAEEKAGQPTAEDGLDREPFEMRLDRRMRQASIDWTWSHPGRVIQLAGVKFLRMWNIWPNEPRLSSWPIRLAVFFTYTPLMIFVIIGTWRTVGRGWPYVLCWMPAVYLTMLHVVFVGSLRYREPAMLALLALAAGGMIGIMDWGLGIGKRRTSTRIPNS